jgi:transposase
MASLWGVGFCREAEMKWFRVQLTADEQRLVREDRESHPQLRVRQKMAVLWLLHCGVTREKAAEITGVARSTVQRYVEAFRAGGLDGLRRWDVRKPESELTAYRDVIRASFENQPVCTTAEACERIYQLTGLRRGLSQTRKFLKGLGLKWQRVRAIPVPPKKTWRSTSPSRPCFTTSN